MIDQAPSDVKVGTDTRSTVLSRLGSPTAKSAIDRLCEIGVLEDMSEKSYRRAYGAMGVIRAVESL